MAFFIEDLELVRVFHFWFICLFGDDIPEKQKGLGHMVCWLPEFFMK